MITHIKSNALFIKSNLTPYSCLSASIGNKLRAARRLGMGRTTLWRKLKEYQIDLKKIA